MAVLFITRSFVTRAAQKIGRPCGRPRRNETANRWATARLSRRSLCRSVVMMMVMMAMMVMMPMVVMPRRPEAAGVVVPVAVPPMGADGTDLVDDGGLLDRSAKSACARRHRIGALGQHACGQDRRGGGEGEVELTHVGLRVSLGGGPTRLPCPMPC